MEKQRQILIVDRNSYVRINCRVMLHGEEFVVFTEEEKDEAFKRVAQDKFDLVITDIRLPNVHGGLTFVQEIRMLQPHADIVVTADRPSIWDAREAVRLGAVKYIEKPLIPEFLIHVAQRAFDRNGWILKKAYIDHFRDYVNPASVADNPTIYYKSGVWARHSGDDIWEVGYDMKHQPAPGEPSAVKISEGLSALAPGLPYAHIVNTSGKSTAVTAPMAGVVKEINGEANNTLTSLAPGEIGVDWMLWLARIQTRFPQKNTVMSRARGVSLPIGA